jgi:sulfate adenylyltransferase subunit 2
LWLPGIQLSESGASALAETRNILPKHLRRLEAESIEIMREVVAECTKPVMLYSIGKDSSVMPRLAIKTFYPAPIPFPLMHVDAPKSSHLRSSALIAHC